MGQVQTECNIANDAVANLVVGIVYFIIIGCEFFISYQLKFKKGKNSKESSNKSKQKTVKERD